MITKIEYNVLKSLNENIKDYYIIKHNNGQLFLKKMLITTLFAFPKITGKQCHVLDSIDFSMFSKVFTSIPNDDNHRQVIDYIKEFEEYRGVK